MRGCYPDTYIKPVTLWYGLKYRTCFWDEVPPDTEGGGWYFQSGISGIPESYWFFIYHVTIITYIEVQRGKLYTHDKTTTCNSPENLKIMSDKCF